MGQERWKKNTQETNFTRLHSRTHICINILSSMQDTKMFASNCSARDNTEDKGRRS